ncbi:glycosyltransferase family 4 protein [Roseateles sp. LKC17W]|uniref:Glycosyltransferase family 4 protein n=1 Tax=Pelomonas margarita TaxID=3299031 RepID=A0ABW7FQ28_9BURK
MTSRVPQPVRLLIVHSSAELYGSDRSLLDFVSLQQGGFEITVLLPEDGPLVPLLRAAGARVAIGEVCKVQRSMLGPRGLLRTLAATWRALREIRQLAGDRPFDLVYTNTVAVFAGAAYALLVRRPHVWHIREILAGSPTLSRAFRAIVSALSRVIISNSRQTQAWIELPRSRERCRVVWNGVAVAAPQGRREREREARGWDGGTVVFALAGRLNAWKGQGLALEAFERVHAELGGRVALWLVGSPFAGQEHFEQALRAQLAASPAAGAARLEPFRPDVEAVWEAADVVLVPSIDPEPFGRVAIEAMAFGRPVIAAAHGGLLDIVTDGDSGLLVPPRSAEALAAAMQRLATDAQARAQLGAQARTRQQQVFSVDAYVQGVTHALQHALDPTAPARARAQP